MRITKLARLTHDVALPAGHGLEFGPAANPTPLPDGLHVAYVDHGLDAAAGLPGAAPLDHAWAGSGSLVAVLGRGGYDFALAAQVAQYVPNLLGWLRGIHGALRPGGVLNLSLPDKRFMFDAAKPVSTLPELIEADLLAYVRPSVRQVFAHAYEARAITPEQIWAGADPAAAPRMAGTAALAHACAEAARAQDAYVPSDCWVFTPASFLAVIDAAGRAGLFGFVLNRISLPEPGGFEFYVSMRRDAEEDPDALRALQEGAIGHLRGLLDGQARTAALLAG